VYISQISVHMGKTLRILYDLTERVSV